ncbi:MAG: energy-coupling factor transporter transmembrane component T [Methylocystaceae bacterium]
MYLYQHHDQVLYHLHPFSLTLMTLVLVALSFMLTQPMLLGALLLAAYADLHLAGLERPARGYLSIGLTMGAFIILINLFFNHNGSTIIFGVPTLGDQDIIFTLEVLVFALVMSARLLIILEAFCLFTYLVNPDQIVKYLARWGGNTALVLALTLHQLPLMIKKLAEIKEIQSCRGLDWEENGVIKRLQHSRPLVMALLQDSLEDSMQVAESMQTRGFGAGVRTIYYQGFWTFKDYLFTGVTVIGLLLGVIFVIRGESGFAFYPVVGPIISPEIILFSAGLFLLFSYPALLSEGWRLWHSWKSTI